MFLNALYIIILTATWHMREVSGDASFICRTAWCPIPMTLGLSMNKMGIIARTIDTRQSVQVLRGRVLLSNNDAYVIGETLTVRMSTGPSKVQVVYQATGTYVPKTAKFAGTCCSGNRYTESSPTGVTIGGSFVIGAGTTGDISFFACWSTKDAPNAISMYNTAAFTLKAPLGIVASPTASSTLAPLMPTPVPSAAATAIPSSTRTPSSSGCNCAQVCSLRSSSTAAPTSIGFSCTCDCSPTAKPSQRPSASPTRPTSTPSRIPTPRPQRPTSEPSPEPTYTGMPTSSPTLTESTERFTVQTSLRAENMTLLEFYGIQTSLTSYIANSVSKDTTFVFVVPVSLPMPEFLTNRTSRSLLSKSNSAVFPSNSAISPSSSVTFKVIVTGISNIINANQTALTLDAYLTDKDFFLYDLLTLAPGVLSLIVVDNMSMMQVSSLPSLDFTCKLSDSFSLSWTKISSTSLRVRGSVNKDQTWISFGLIRPAFLMAPKNEVHNVFIFDPSSSVLARYFMTGLTASSIIREESNTRLNSGVVSVQRSPVYSFIDVDMSTLTELHDPQLNIAGINYITWANGGQWPEIHKDYGFVQVNWNHGTCNEVEIGLSSFYVFIVPGIAILIGLIRYFMHIELFDKILSQRHHYFLDYTVGGTLLILSFIGICIAVLLTSLTQYPEITTMITAVGKLSLMSFWLALFPSSKTCCFVWLTSVPFERSIKYHKNISYFAIITSIIHLILTAMKSLDLVISGEITYWKRVIPLNGLIAFIIFCSMSLLAFEPIRRAKFEAFILTHQIYPIGIYFICIHVQYAYIGFLPGAFLHAIDICVFIYGWFIRLSARIEAYGGITIIEIESSRAQYEPGCYYFLNIPRISLIEWHPFSVSSSTLHKITFHIKALNSNTFTRNLYDVIRTSLNSSDGEKYMKICICGPYGHISLKIDEYSAITCLVGGIGITPMLTMMEYILQNIDKYNNLILLDLRWVIREIDLLKHFGTRIGEILLSQISHTNIRIHVTIYITNESVIDDARNSIEIRRFKDHPRFTLMNGRPPIQKIVYVLSKLIMPASLSVISPAPVLDLDQTTRVVRPSKGCILICGPASMTKEASVYATKAGVDFHAEVFAF